MKNFIQTLRNILRIDDLRNRILATLGLVLVYRVGAHIVLPGIDPNKIAALGEQTKDGIMSILNMFSGGAFANASIFALGIMPYITASIIVQLLGMAAPYFQRLQRDGESGRRKINRIIRILTVGVMLVQAPSYLINLHYQLPDSAFLAEGFWGFTFPSVIILTAGTMFIMWLGERITDKGIGNGISLLIMIGIIARLPFAFGAEFVSRVQEVGGGGLIALIVELVMLFLVFVVSILLVQGTRKIPVQYAKRIVGNKQYGGVRQYIPLKVNAAGVMPIIFAQALMFIPLMFTHFNTEATSSIATAFADYTGFWYAARDCLHVFLYGDYIQPAADGGRDEEAWRLHPRREAWQEDRRVPRRHHVAHHSSRLHLPCAHRHPAGVRDTLPRQQPVCPVLRRHLVADYGGRHPRHLAAD